jgi:hypothetical protein
MTGARLLALLMVSTLGGVPAATANADSSPVKRWQMARLLEPTQADLRAEAKGRVMIYDGLTDRDVERAFDEQFDRLEHMMFIRVVVTDDSGKARRSETGEVVTESDDGCD